MTSLFLGKNKITKIANLDKQTKLKLLSLQSNRIVIIENLDKLVELEELYLSHNGVQVSVLSKLYEGMLLLYKSCRSSKTLNITLTLRHWILRVIGLS